MRISISATLDLEAYKIWEQIPRGERSTFLSTILKKREKKDAESS